MLSMALFALSTNVASAESNMSLAKHHSYTTELIKGKSWQPGNAYIEKALQRVALLNDYMFESKMTAKVKNKVSQNGGKFYFKKSKRLRIEVKSKGRNNGAVVVKKK